MLPLTRIVALATLALIAVARGATARAELADTALSLATRDDLAERRKGRWRTRRRARYGPPRASSARPGAIGAGAPVPAAAGDEPVAHVRGHAGAGAGPPRPGRPAEPGRSSRRRARAGRVAGRRGRAAGPAGVAAQAALPAARVAAGASRSPSGKWRCCACSGDRSLREIAKELYVSLNTVKTHTQAIYRKLGVSTRQDAVLRGQESGVL